MDYEDKHKEEIIRATQLWECGDITRENLEYIFPELAESDDEKNIKDLIDELKCSLRAANCQNDACGGGHEKRIALLEWAIAWLEKQGDKSQGKTALEAIHEEKVDNAIKVEPTFKVGDWCIDNEDGVIFQIVKVLDNTYTYKTNEGKEYSCTHYSLENDARLWTIKDAKDGDVLAAHECIVLFKEIDGLNIKCYCTYHYMGFNPSFHIDTLQNKTAFNPATKEQRDLLFAKMKEEGWEWDADKKELKKIEDEEYNGEDYGIDSLFHAQRILEKTLGEVEGYQSDDGILEHKCAISAVKKLYARKPAKWSEEDEVKINRIVACLENLNVADNDILLKDVEWLKSLKQRMEEQQ